MSLKDFIQNIEQGTDDARFVLWKQEYDKLRSKENNYLSVIMNGPDGILKLLLVRFFSQIPEELAVRQLVVLMNDTNMAVAEAAKKSYERNRLSGKAAVLIPVLSSPHKHLVHFAIDEIGLNGVDDALTKLLAMLPQADEELLYKLLSAFRHIAKLDVLPVLHQFKQDKREEIRLRLVLIYASLYHAGHKLIRFQLLPYLDDASPIIRRITIWALRRLKNRKDVKVYKKMATFDVDPLVRQEAVSALGDFFQPKLVPFFLSIMAHDLNRYVVLKAESLLIEKPFHTLTRGLKKVLHSRDEKVSYKAILLYAASHRGSDNICRYLIKQFYKATSERKQIIFIEALGVLEHPESANFLRQLIKGPILLSYAACVALGKVWRRHGGDYYFEIIRSENISSVNLQVFLKHIVFQNVLLTDADRNVMMSFLSSSNMNVRYLAGQILGKRVYPECFVCILEAWSKETETSVRFSLEKNISYYATQDSDLLKILLKFCLNKNDDLDYLLKLFELVHFSTETKLFEFIRSLLDNVIEFPSQKERLYQLILKILSNGQLGWMPVIELIESYGDEQASTLLIDIFSVAEKSPEFIFQKNELSAIFEHFRESKSISDDLLVTLMLLSQGDMLLGEIVEIISQSSNLAHVKIAKDALNKYLQGAAPL